MKKEILAGLAVTVLVSASGYVWNYLQYSKLKGDWEGSYSCSKLKPRDGVIKKWTLEDAGNLSFLVRLNFERGKYKGKVECISDNQSWFGIKLNCENDANGDTYVTHIKRDGHNLALKYAQNKNCETGSLSRIE